MHLDRVSSTPQLLGYAQLLFHQSATNAPGEIKNCHQIRADLVERNAVNHHGMYLPLLAPGQ